MGFHISLTKSYFTSNRFGMIFFSLFMCVSSSFDSHRIFHLNCSQEWTDRHTYKSVTKWEKEKYTQNADWIYISMNIGWTFRSVDSATQIKVSRYRTKKQKWKPKTNKIPLVTKRFSVQFFFFFAEKEKNVIQKLQKTEKLSEKLSNMYRLPLTIEISTIDEKHEKTNTQTIHSVHNTFDMCKIWIGPFVFVRTRRV